MIEPITLYTERLTLRTPVEADFPAVSEFARSPRSHFTGGPHVDPFACWRGFLGSIGHWSLRGYGFFTVLADDRPVGRVGIVNHIMWDEPELGWQLFDGFEGRGYATEAARAARHWAHEARGLGPLISYIHPDNTRSIRVAERLGARHERDCILLDHPAQVWRHPQEGAA